MLAGRVLPGHRLAGAPSPPLLPCPCTYSMGGLHHVATKKVEHVAGEQTQRCSHVIVAAKRKNADVEEAPKASTRTPRDQKNTAPEVLERGAPEHPYPGEFQQTLNASFTLGGVGLHTGEYAVVRVRPAFANEGRYFVRVPEGTNADKFLMQEPAAVEVETGGQAPLDPELEDKKLQLFKQYLMAQEDEGFEGTFDQYLHDIDTQDITERWHAGENVADQEFDLPEPEAIQGKAAGEVVVPAALNQVKESAEMTISLGDIEEDDPQVVISVQPLLAALEAAGVDNARIEIEGGYELPQLDGSALGWAMGIHLHGVRVAPNADGSPEPVPRRGLLLREPFTVNQDDGSFVSYVPEMNVRLTAGIDEHQVAQVIGKQWKSWCLYEDLPFRFELAGAREWVASPESLQYLSEHGYYQGGTDGTVLVAYGERWFDPQLVRHVDDEVARHEIVTLMGVLALTALPGHAGLPFGHIMAHKATPELMVEFARQMMSRATPDKYVNVWDVPLSTDFLTMEEAVKAGLVVDEAEEGEEEEGLGDGADLAEDEFADDDEQEEEQEEQQKSRK